MSKTKATKTDTNLVKSTTNDQIETDNDKVGEVTKSKRDQFLNLLGVQPNEEFYIEGTEKNPPYSIYKLSDDLYLSARSSNSKDWDMSWAANMFIGRLLSDDVKLIKIKK